MARAEAKITATYPESVVTRHAKMEALFADPSIDIVLLVLPIPLAPVAIEAALRAGKHVLSEKPAAPTIESALRLVDVLRELGPRAPMWLVLENWALKPSVVWLRERLQEGAIGRVQSVHCEHHHPEVLDAGRRAATTRGGASDEPHEALPASWRSAVDGAGDGEGDGEGGDGDDEGAASSPSGGWLVDLGVHWARLLRRLLGEPLDGAAILGPTATPGGSALQGWLRFSHVEGACTLSWSHGGPARKGAASGAGAPPSVRLEGERGRLCWWAEGGGARGQARVLLERFGGGADASPGDSGRAGDETYLRLDDDWVDGGVAACLECALTAIRVVTRQRAGDAGMTTPLQHGALARGMLGYDEAMRDLALIHTLRATRRHQVARVAATVSSGWPSPRAGAGATPLLQPPRQIWDASGTRAVTPRHVIPCHTCEEVVAALRFAAAEGLQARPIGWAHSWSASYAGDAGVCTGPDAAGTGDVHEAPPLVSLRLAGMDRVLAVDAARRRITVEPGVTLRELRRVLARHELTLGSWPMLLDQTVGGATVGCGSHGSAPRDGTLADVLVSVRLVSTAGRVVTLRDDTKSASGAEALEALAAAGAADAAGDAAPAVPSLRAFRVSLGRAGVAVALTLECEPAYYVRRQVHTLAAADFVGRAEALCEAYRHVWVWWALGQSDVCACTLEDVGTLPAPGAVRYDGENWYRGTPPLAAPRDARDARDARAGSSEAVDAAAAAEDEPAALPEAATLEGQDGAAHMAAAAAADASTAGSRLRWVSMQYAFPRERLEALVTRLGSEEFLASSGCAGRVVELKFVGGRGGRASLGVNADGPVVCANVLWRLRLPHSLWRLQKLEDALRALGGKPHLGKRHTPVAEPVTAA